MLNIVNSSKSLKKAFTIVELLVVIVVIGILATITIVSYRGVQESADVARMQSDFESIENAINIYEAKNGVYPECAAGGAGCSFSEVVSLLRVDGIPTTNPDGSDILYVSNNSSNHRWAVRFKSETTGDTCKQGFNVSSGWWVGSDPCW